MKTITRKPWEYEQCENCGEDLTVLSECEEESLVQDGDEVECEVCGIVGTICCDSETSPYVSFYDDPAVLTADLIEKCKALLSERKRLREALEDQCYCANLNDLAEMHFEPRDQVCEPCQALAASSSPEPEATGGQSG